MREKLSPSEQPKIPSVAPKHLEEGLQEQQMLPSEQLLLQHCWH